jgi:hypothetical protein
VDDDQIVQPALLPGQALEHDAKLGRPPERDQDRRADTL